MLEPERHAVILRLLKQRGVASTHEICKATDASEATVRRDLSKLEEDALIRRVHGGAELAETAVTDNINYGEVPLAFRKSFRLEEKIRIARYAAGLCEKNETVIIDGGSTTFQMAPFLKDAGCRIITNSFGIAEILLRKGNNQVIIPGGMIYKNSELILDPFQGDFYRNYAAGKAFMGAGGIGPKGLTNSDPQLIKAERRMIEHAEEVIILADSTKFDYTGTLYLCGFDALSMIITDTGITDKQRDMAESRGIRLVAV